MYVVGMFVYFIHGIYPLVF